MHQIARSCHGHAPVSRTCTCALVVGALVKDIGEEGPWKDIPVHRYTFSWDHDNGIGEMTCINHLVCKRNDDDQRCAPTPERGARRDAYQGYKDQGKG